MKNVLFVLISIFIFTNTSKAEVIPPGCYVADFYRTDQCWYASDNLYVWDTFLDRTQGVSTYGPAMEAVAYHGSIQGKSLDICVADYNAVVLSYNSNLGVISSQTKLIKKLRKKCGAACKRVK